MKTLVITGASKGIGLQTATEFLELGYRVINLSRTPAPHPLIENHAIDLSFSDTDETVRTLLDKLVGEGEICLVHNAARLANDSAMSADTDSFREMMNINVVAPHILNQVLLPQMTPGSSVIYLGSTLSEKAVPNCYSYVVSKHAIVGMMRATCQDLKDTGIHTCCVCPGFTDTEMLRDHVGANEAVLAEIAQGSTFGRLVKPDEIAALITFAALNPVINGAVLHANLGQIEH